MKEKPVLKKVLFAAIALFSITAFTQINRSHTDLDDLFQERIYLAKDADILASEIKRIERALQQRPELRGEFVNAIGDLKEASSKLERIKNQLNDHGDPGI